MLTINDFERKNFPSGEVNILVDKPVNLLLANLRTSEDIIKFMLITDAIKRTNNTNVDLIIPYVPYARQDRICNIGEALSIKVFCDLINNMKYRSVTIVDPHSDVTGALLNNCNIIGMEDIFKNIDYPIPKTLICPDAGAQKKILKLAKVISATEIIKADKIRNTTDGSITGTKVYCGDLEGKDVLIADDICDGGMTFIKLAEALKEKNAGKIYLYVTHGIFSKGINVFRNLFYQIYTTNSYCQLPNNNVLTVFPLDYLYKGVVYVRNISRRNS